MTQPIQGTYTFEVLRGRALRQNKVNGEDFVVDTFTIILKVSGVAIGYLEAHDIIAYPQIEATAKLFCNSMNLLQAARNVIEQVDPCLTLNGSQKDAIQKLNKEILTSTL